MNYETNDNSSNDDFFGQHTEAGTQHQSTNIANDDPQENDVPVAQSRQDAAAPMCGNNGHRGNGSGGSGSTPSCEGHNSRRYVRDLILDPRFHERHAFDPDDIKRMEPLASNHALHRPVRVVEKDGELYYADSTVFCRALLAVDLDAKVEIEIVSESDAIAIRQQDNSKRSKREPMSKARRALMLTNANVPTKDIMMMLSVNEPRISQLCAVARTEAEFAALAALVTNRVSIPPRFWSAIHDTRVARGKLDLAKPKKDGPSRVEEFEAKITALVAENTMLSVEDIRDRLGLNDKSNGKKPVRMRGTRVSCAGLKLRVTADKERRTLSIDPAYPKQDFKKLIDHVTKFLIDQQNNDGTALQD